MITDEWQATIEEHTKLRRAVINLTSQVSTLSDEVWRLSNSKQTKGVVTGLVVGAVFGAASVAGMILIVLR